MKNKIHIDDFTIEDFEKHFSSPPEGEKWNSQYDYSLELALKLDYGGRYYPVYELARLLLERKYDRETYGRSFSLTE